MPWMAIRCMSVSTRARDYQHDGNDTGTTHFQSDTVLYMLSFEPRYICSSCRGFVYSSSGTFLLLLRHYIRHLVLVSELSLSLSLSASLSLFLHLYPHASRDSPRLFVWCHTHCGPVGPQQVCPPTSTPPPIGRCRCCCCCVLP